MSHMSPLSRSAPPRCSRLLLAGACALALGGCSGVLWGQLFVVGAALGIFVGTLSLGRSAAAASTAGEASTTRR